MTVLDACVDVLKANSRPMNVKEVLTEIEARQLYVFKAKDPLKVVGSAIRNNLKNGRPPVVTEVAKGTFALA